MLGWIEKWVPSLNLFAFLKVPGMTLPHL